MNQQPTDLQQRLSHGIFINNVPVVPVVGVAYVILATLVAGAASPAPGLRFLCWDSWPRSSSTLRSFGKVKAFQDGRTRASIRIGTIPA